MSKLARERKKHWRVVKAIAKEQGIELLEPRKPSRGFWKYWETLYSKPFNFTPSVIYFYTPADVDDELNGLSINQVWYDEENIDGGQII